jgi:hypothetical protein
MSLFWDMLAIGTRFGALMRDAIILIAPLASSFLSWALEVGLTNVIILREIVFRVSARLFVLNRR